ncbi:MAG: phage holin family protein [Bacilli bacterium]|nr:phage holin family protein [Bacilli bacterium]
MSEIIKMISNSKSVKILIVCIILDVVFGILRALKEKKINSCIGIDGIIRKVGMILSIAFCFVIDYISHFNLIGFLPESITESLHLGQCGLAFIFNSLYIVFEGLSILKNMIKCKMPIPKKLQEYLEKLLYEFTNENKEK